MTEATFFETRQFSPTGLMPIIALHAAAITAALAWKLELIIPDRKPTVVTSIPIEQPPEVEQETKVRPPQVDVFIPPSHSDPLPVPDPVDMDFTADPPPIPRLPDYVVPNDPPPVLAPQVQSARAKGDVRTLITADDYPDSARRNEETGTVRARLEIGANGKVTGCSIVTSSGSAALDSKTCNVLRARARFAPARDDAGQAVSDSYVTPKIVWRIEKDG